MNQRSIALAAALLAALIYSLNHLIAKDIMAEAFPASLLVFIRVSGATVLFWFFSIFVSRERIHKSHYIRIGACALLGGSLNMICFFKGLSLSTPINSSLVITILPIIVAVLSVIFLKENLTVFRTFGILLSMGGAVSLLIFSEEKAMAARDIPLGNFFFVGNVVLFGSYYVVVKPLLEIYHPFNLMRWIFLLGSLVTIPFAHYDYRTADWANHDFFQTNIILETLYVVVCTTFLTYVCNMYALRRLRATTLSIFSYLQPMMVIIIAALLDLDKMNFLRYIACGLIFSGVYIVTRKPEER